MRIIKQAFAFHSVPSCPSGFLVIIFYAFGNIEVDHKPDIGFIDPHSKGDSCHNNLYILVHELVLPVCPHLAVHPCMISHSLDVVGHQHIGKLFGGLPVEGIDDAAFAAVIMNEFDDALNGILLVDFWPDLVVEIGSIKGGNEDLRLAEAQVFNNVLLHFWGSRCR